jgi:phospholipase/carboxylesterase/glyoxalase family protein
MAADLGFIHRYEPASTPGQPTLLLLHGTGGNEDDLVPLVPELLPGANVLSPRGRVMENGMPRFFRRLAEGVFDLEDLRFRASELADFVLAAAAHYKFDRSRIVAVGFSNGANIASSVMLLRPGVLAGAVLLRAQVPIVPDPVPVQPGTHVLISNGQADPLVSPAETERLASLLRSTDAEVSLIWQPGGHNLTRGDLAAARAWLAKNFGTL